MIYKNRRKEFVKCRIVTNRVADVIKVTQNITMNDKLYMMKISQFPSLSAIKEFDLKITQLREIA